MAKFPIILEGYDPTSDVTAITRAQLLAMVHEAEHVDFVGSIIHSSTAPNVSLYPKLRDAFWHKLTLEGIGTGELYWYNVNVADWLPLTLSIGSLNGSRIADKSIGLIKLDPTGLGALAIVRVNAIGDAFEAVSVDAIFAIGSIALNKLAAAPSPDFTIISGVGGVPEWRDFIDYLTALLTGGNYVPHTTIYDGDNSGVVGQVLGRTTGVGSAAGLTFSYIESLLRPNQTPTNKLLYQTGLAGQLLQVNPTGTDVQGISPSVLASGKEALFVHTDVSGTVAQVVPITTETLIQFNSEIDLDNIVALTANQFSVAAIGRYKIQAFVPVFTTATGDTDIEIVLALYDVTATNTLLRSVSNRLKASTSANGGFGVIPLTYIVEVTALPQVFDLRIFSSQAISLGAPASVVGYPETYQQLTFTKLA